MFVRRREPIRGTGLNAVNQLFNPNMRPPKTRPLAAQKSDTFCNPYKFPTPSFIQLTRAREDDPKETGLYTFPVQPKLSLEAGAMRSS